MLNYCSQYTKRALTADVQEVAKLDVAEIVERERVKAANKLEQARRREMRKGFAERRWEQNEAVRKERREIRRKVCFSSELEAEMPPFRSFKALDNLGKSQVMQKQDRSLERIRREKLRQIEKVDLNRAKNRFRCDPKKVLSTKVLSSSKYEAVKVAESKNEIIHELLETKYYIANQQKKEVKPKTKAVTVALIPERDEKFNGLFNIKADIKEEEKNEGTEEQKPLEVHQPANAFIPGKIVPSRAQNKFVHLAGIGALDEMKKTVRQYFKTSELDINALAVDDGVNAMHAAAANGHVHVLDYLLQMGINTKILTCEGKSVLDCIEEGVVSDPDYFHHLNLPRIKSMFQSSSIFVAAKLGDLERVEWLLDNNDTGVNDRNIYNMTPLHYAYMGQHLDIAVLLLHKFNANPEATNHISQKPRDMCDPCFHDRVLRELELIEHEENERIMRMKHEEERLQALYG